MTFAGFALMFQGVSLVSPAAWVVIFSHAVSAIMLVIGGVGGTRTFLCSRLDASLADASYGSFSGNFARDGNIVFQVSCTRVRTWKRRWQLEGRCSTAPGLPAELRGASNLVVGVGAAVTAPLLRCITAPAYLSTQIGGGPSFSKSPESSS